MEIYPRLLQVRIRCQACGHTWPQVLDRHLQEIECHHCEARQASVIYINEKDLDQWQQNLANVKTSLAMINASVLSELQENEILIS